MKVLRPGRELGIAPLRPPRASCAYRAAGREVASLVRLSVSGRELVDRGYSGDLDLALEQDASTSVPVLTDGAYRAA